MKERGGNFAILSMIPAVPKLGEGFDRRSWTILRGGHHRKSPFFQAQTGALPKKPQHLNDSPGMSQP
jgi:hypothetical protein